jgi:hypothetical protein
MGFYLKDPQSRIDYAIDWLGYLDGQAVVQSAWTVTPDEPGGIVVDSAGYDPARTAARLSGGVAGHVYSVSNLVTLTDGSREERSITLRVEQR